MQSCPCNVLRDPCNDVVKDSTVNEGTLSVWYNCQLFNCFPPIFAGQTPEATHAERHVAMVHQIHMMADPLQKLKDFKHRLEASSDGATAELRVSILQQIDQLEQCITTALGGSLPLQVGDTQPGVKTDAFPHTTPK